MDVITLTDSLADFSQRWQGLNQGIRSRALICSQLCSELMEKVSFSESKTRLQFRAVDEQFLLA